MGRLWRFAETIDTDVLAPAFFMKAPLDELASYCLEAVRSKFASNVKAGDIMMVGENMGVGSSREQALEVLKHIGISCVIAPSFAGVFYRNTINLGLRVFTLAASQSLPSELGDRASTAFDFDAAPISLKDHAIDIQADPLPSFLRNRILDGGLVDHLEKPFCASE